MDKKMDKKFISSKEAGEILNISQRNLKKLVRKKKIKSYKVGGKIIRYDLGEIRNFQGQEGNLYKFRYGGMINRLSDIWKFGDTYIIFAVLVFFIIMGIVFVMV